MRHFKSSVVCLIAACLMIGGIETGKHIQKTIRIFSPSSYIPVDLIFDRKSKLQKRSGRTFAAAF